MKRKKACLCLLFSALLLCSCYGRNAVPDSEPGAEEPSEEENQNVETVRARADEYVTKFLEDRIPISEYKDQYAAEQAEVSQKTTGRITFSDCVFGSLDRVESVNLLALDYGQKLSVEEGLKVIADWLEEENITSVDLEQDVYDASGQLPRNDALPYPECYPRVSEHKQELKYGSGFFVNTDDAYIQLGYSIYAMSDGVISKFAGPDAISYATARSIEDMEIAESGSLEELKDKSYELLNGPMTVQEAADITIGYFDETGAPNPPVEGCETDIGHVTVYSLKDKYVYCFSLRRIYHGLPFACGEYGRGSASNLQAEVKEAYVFSGKVNSYNGYSDDIIPEPLIEDQDSIIGLKEAADILNRKMAPEIEAKITKTELVYIPKSISDRGDYYIAYPCWQFIGTIEGTYKNVRIYVDALTGDVDYCYRDYDW